jgi:hypothetical protein
MHKIGIVGAFLLSICSTSCGAPAEPAAVTVVNGGGAVEITVIAPNYLADFSAAKGVAEKVLKSIGGSANVVQVLVVPTIQVHRQIRWRNRADNLGYDASVAEYARDGMLSEPIARLISIAGDYVFEYRSGNGSLREALGESGRDPRRVSVEHGEFRLLHISLLRSAFRDRTPEYSLTVFLQSDTVTADGLRDAAKMFADLSGLNFVTVSSRRDKWFSQPAYPIVLPWIDGMTFPDKDQYEEGTSTERTCFYVGGSARC